MFVLKKRLKLGLKRAGRAAILRQAAGPQAGKMFVTGVRPQLCYGHTVAGMALSQRRSVLQAARRVSGAAGMRSCPITTVFIRLGILPVAQVQIDQVRLWLQLWKRSHLRADYTKTWRVIRDETEELSQEDAWARTAGPIGACINVLRAAGWVPIQPDRWIAPGEQMAVLSAPEPHAESDIMAAVSADLRRAQWSEASRHFMGRGLEQGCPSFEAHAAARRILLKRVDSEAARDAAPPLVDPLLPSASARIAALDAIVAGGATVGERYSESRPCLRCGAMHETAFHRYFGCPANQCPHLRAMDSSLERTDFVGKSTLDGKGEFEECFWARGIIPASKSSLLCSTTVAAPPVAWRWASSTGRLQSPVVCSPMAVEGRSGQRRRSARSGRALRPSLALLTPMVPRHKSTKSVCSSAPCRPDNQCLEQRLGPELLGSAGPGDTPPSGRPARGRIGPGATIGTCGAPFLRSSTARACCAPRRSKLIARLPTLTLSASP